MTQPSLSPLEHHFPDLHARISALLDRHRVPGAAVLLIDAGRVMIATFGRSDAAAASPVTPDTAFDIASCSKAFLGVMAGIAADEGRIDLDCPITRQMDDVRFCEPALDAAVTVRDLLSNRVGFFPLHPLDFMLNQDIGDDEVIRRLAYVPLERPFRSGFSYFNPGFKLVSILLGRQYGMPYGRLLRERLFRPLGIVGGADPTLWAMGHTEYEGHILPVNLRPNEGDDGSGGIYLSAADTAHWLYFQLALAQGRGAGTGLISQERHADLMRPHVSADCGVNPGIWPTDATDCAYAAGWGLSRWQGDRLFQHSGSVLGWRSAFGMLPDRGQAAAILLNKANRVHAMALPMMFDALAGRDVDREAAIIAWEEDAVAKRRDIFGEWKKSDGPSSGTDRYCGRYLQPAGGPILVDQSASGELRFIVEDGIAWNATLSHAGGHAFRLHYDDVAVFDDAGPEPEHIRFIVTNGRVDGFESLIFGRYQRVENP